MIHIILWSCLTISFYAYFSDAVIMQVQRAAPLDLQCKDKFLIQSTVVPSGTVEEDITPGMVRVGLQGFRFFAEESF